MKKHIWYLFILSTLYISLAHADPITSGISETTNWAQVIVLSACGLAGTVGGGLMLFTEYGSSWVTKSLLVAAIVGIVPFAVKEIAGFFGVG